MLGRRSVVVSPCLQLDVDRRFELPLERHTPSAIGVIADVWRSVFWRLASPSGNLAGLSERDVGLPGGSAGEAFGHILPVPAIETVFGSRPPGCGAQEISDRLGVALS
jgi:hypothetical protein